MADNTISLYDGISLFRKFNSISVIKINICYTTAELAVIANVVKQSPTYNCAPSILCLILLKKLIERGGCIYIMTNIYDGILYAGVTSDLRGRVLWQHKNNYYPNSFTSKYKCYKLFYYRFFPHIEEAITEENRIKAGNRKSK